MIDGMEGGTGGLVEIGVVLTVAVSVVGTLITTVSVGPFFVTTSLLVGSRGCDFGVGEGAWDVSA